MRQEGSQTGANGNPVTGPGSGTGGSNGIGSLMGESNTMSHHQTVLEDMHQHLHSQTAQTLNFGDIYWVDEEVRRRKKEMFLY